MINEVITFRFKEFEWGIQTNSHLWRNSFIIWKPEEIKLVDDRHSLLRHLFYKFPNETGFLMLEYIYYYKEYEFFEALLKSGTLDKFLDGIIIIAANNNYHEITLICIRYMNTLKRENLIL